MRRRMVNGKIHRARVTEADLNYVGSISIDPILMKAADIVPNEQVAVYNLMNGARFETYAIEGVEGQVCLNGAAARLAQVDDLVIIVTYVDVDEQEVPPTTPMSSSSTRRTSRPNPSDRPNGPSCVAITRWVSGTTGAYLLVTGLLIGENGRVTAESTEPAAILATSS